MGGRSILQDSDNRLWTADRPHSLPPPLPYLCSFSSTLSLSCSFTLSPLFSIYLAQFLWEQPARGALKLGRRRKQSQVCRGNMMGPKVGLRGEGQTLECVTKGWASLLMTPTGETSCSVCKGLHMHCYCVGLTRRCDRACSRKHKLYKTWTAGNMGMHTRRHSHILVFLFSHTHVYTHKCLSKKSSSPFSLSLFLSVLNLHSGVMRHDAVLWIQMLHCMYSVDFCQRQ